MPMVRAMRMLNAIEAGTTTGAQLETLLTADPGRLAELNVLLGMRGQARRLAASSTAMTAVAASSTAMTAVAASSTAMTAVAASSTAMTAVAASSTARLAIWNSDTALAAIQASNMAVTTMMAAPTAVSANTASSSYAFVPSGTKVILLRRWYSNTSEHDKLMYGRATETLPGYGFLAVKYGPTYDNTGTGPTTDDVNANNVRACNGLSRETWSSGATLYVRYLPV